MALTHHQGWESIKGIQRGFLRARRSAVLPRIARDGKRSLPAVCNLHSHFATRPQRRGRAIETGHQVFGAIADAHEVADHQLGIVRYAEAPEGWTLGAKA